MSVEVNCYEELIIKNVNEKTAAICDLVGEYLIANWGINFLKLTVDGKQYESHEGIAEGSQRFSLLCELVVHLVSVGGWKNPL